MNIKKAIQRIMMIKGVKSVQSLAQQTGVSYRSLNAWIGEEISPSISSLEDLCKGLNIALSTFVMLGEVSDDQIINIKAEIGQE